MELRILRVRSLGSSESKDPNAEKRTSMIHWMHDAL